MTSVIPPITLGGIPRISSSNFGQLIDGLSDPTGAQPRCQEKEIKMDISEAKEKIVEALSKKKGKSKFYFNDLSEILELKPRDAKKLINVLVTDGVLEYWSSGSTSMYGLKGAGKQAGAEDEE
jgi:hypothetical protein